MNKEKDNSYIVIYDHPKEYPDWFVALKWRMDGGKPVPNKVIFSKGITIWDVRKTIPIGMGRVERGFNDAPDIVETWVPMPECHGLGRKGD